WAREASASTSNASGASSGEGPRSARSSTSSSPRTPPRNRRARAGGSTVLTADLVRATVHRGRVRPCFVDPRDEEMLALAERLIATFEGGAGRPRYEIQGELDDLAGTETDFLLQRGLAKLLFDRSEFATEAVRDPEELRREVFSAAARLHRDRPAGNGIAPGLIDTV